MSGQETADIPNDNVAVQSEPIADLSVESAVSEGAPGVNDQAESGGGSETTQTSTSVGATSHLPPDSPSTSNRDSMTTASNRNSYYDSVSPRKMGNLFFQFGNPNEDDMEELIELQRGKEFPATYVVSESAGKFREVVLNINMAGIKVSEPSNKKRSREFDIEQILQYSYNRAQTRFTFAYLEADGVLTNYRFISKEFFEIHRTLGNAIAMMVKLKGQTEEGEPEQGDAQPMELVPAKSHEDQHAQLDNLNENGDAVETESHDHGESLSPQQTDESLPQATSDVARLSISEEAEQTSTIQSIGDGADDDNMSIMTADTRDEEDRFGDANEIVDPSDAKNKKKTASSTSSGAASKTVRGWGLFGNRGNNSVKHSRKSTSSTNELSIIEEGKDAAHVSHSNERVDTAKAVGGDLHSGSFSSKRFGSMSIIDKSTLRRKSVQDIFRLSDDSKKSGFAQSAMSLSESTSPTSVTAPELPPVDKKFDDWGREILIKNLKGGKYDITAGTADALVDSLAEESAPDTIFIEEFLLTFRHFMTPLQFIKLLQKRFHFNNPDSPQSAAIIRVRAVSVLKKWAERHYYDFRFPEMLEAFELFIKDINESDCAKYAGGIKTTLDAELEKSRNFKEPEKPVVPAEVQKVLQSVDFLTAWSPKRIAQELTLIDLKIFRLIKPDEFTLFLWGDKRDPRIANFNSYIDRFNKIGFWVTTVVCGQKDIKKRVEIIEKYIQICKYLLKYQNFNTLMAILSGLNTTGVSRLKKTWEIVNKSRSISIYKDIEAKMSYKGNFKAYREIEGNAKTPFIPFFGLYVKDLTFMNDGNQKHLTLNPNNNVAATVKATSPSLSSSAASSVLSTLPNTSPTGNSTLSENVTLSSSAKTMGALHESTASMAESANSEKDTTGLIISTTATAPVQQDNASAPPTIQLINFEKCRSITDKIHAIRVYQQSTYKFEEEKEEKDSFFSSFGMGSSATEAELAIYFGHPYGPPACEDENKLLDMSRECEPSARKTEYVTAPASTPAGAESKPRDATAATGSNDTGSQQQSNESGRRSSVIETK